MDFPNDLKYTKDHEWVKTEGYTCYVGITEHAQGELGDIVFIDIPDATATVKQGDSIGTIEAVKTVADVFSPVSGQIIEVNELLNDAPETVNSDPYGDGWLIKIEMSNPDEIKSLMNVDEYKALVGK